MRRWATGVAAAALLAAAAGCGASTSTTSTPLTSTNSSPASTSTTVGHTASSAPAGAGGTVPAMVGQQLDQAEATLLAGGLGYKAFGGGDFGIVDAANWTVCSQVPAAGAHATAVKLVVARACS